MDGKNMAGAIQKVFVFAPEKRNVGSADRIISSAAAGFLSYLGIKSFKKGGYALFFPAGYLLWRSISGFCFLYNLVGIDTTEGADPFEIRRSITIQRNKSDVYNYWRTLENLPSIMTHVSKVEKISENKYRWEVEFNKQHFGWNAEVIEDKPNEKITWMSVDSPDVKNSGSIEFTDAPKGGTEVKVIMIYQPDKTTIGRFVAKLLNPLFKQRIKDDLREFKRMMETEEVTVNEPYVHV